MVRGTRVSGNGSGASCQNALFQALITAYRVSREVSSPVPTPTRASTVPSWTPACSSPTLPRNPDIGGIPARFIADRKNTAPSAGATFARLRSEERRGGSVYLGGQCRDKDKS